MALQIIYGRAGTGKTTKCYEFIKSAADNNEKVLVLTPEHISLQTERNISSIAGIKGTDEITVSGFSRLAATVFSKFGPVLPRFADDTLKAMLIKKILLNNSKKFAVIGNNIENTGFAASVLDTVNSLKASGITVEDLKAIAKSSEKMLTKLKLMDIALVYEKYEEEYNTDLLNSDDNLMLLCEKIESFNLFSNYFVVIDGFNGFSKQQYQLIEVLLKKASKVVVTCATDTLENNMTSVFFRGITVADKLFSLCYECNIEVLPSIYLDVCYKYEKTNDLSHLEANLYKYPYKKFDREPENIKVYEAADYYSEVLYAAKNIYKLCRENGYRYNDFAIVCRNMESYLPIIKKVFAEYDIAHFANEKLDVLKHPYVNSILSAFNVIINNFSPNSLIKWIKADFHNFNREDIYLLENYIIAAGSSEKMWQQPLKYNGGLSESDFERVKAIYPEVLNGILEFSAELKGRKTFKKITNALIKLLDENYINRMYKELNDLYLAKSYVTAYNSLVEALNQINSVFGEFSVTTTKYYEILVSGLSAYEIGTVPVTVDCVTVSEPDLYKEQKKIIFLLGVNEGVLPKGYINEGLLSESDKLLIEQNGYDAPDSNIIKHKAEDYLIYTMLTSPSEKLYVTYSSKNISEDTIEPSSVIGNITDMFPCLRIIKGVYEKTDTIDNVDAVIPTFNRLMADDFTEGSKVIEEWYKANKPQLYEILVNSKNYNNNPEKLREDVIKGLYGETPFYSISKIEQYNRCAFAYFLNYGLRAKPRRENVANAADIGTVMHEVIEKYTLYCNEIGFNNVNYDMCSSLVTEYAREALITCLGEEYFESRKGKVNFKKIVNILKGVVWNITKFYKQSKFELFGSEVDFADDGTFPPIEIPLENGGVAKLTGKIDRIDLLKADDRYYVNVVDYKSSDKTIDYGMTLYGLQIQLPVYIDAICKFLAKRDNVITVPAAMLYCKIDYKAVDGERNYSDEKINEEIQKSLKMKGLVIDTVAVDEAMGTTYCVKPDVTTHQIEVMCKNAYKKINNTIGDILSGNIDIVPANTHGRSSCTYCDYASVCNFDSMFGNVERYIKNIKKEEYFDYVGKMD